MKPKPLKKTTVKNYCDQVWAASVKKGFNDKCIVCSRTSYLNAHHLISRKVLKYRWELLNGVALCPDHHNFSVVISAHTAPWALEEFLQANHKTIYNWFVLHRNDVTSDKFNYVDKYFQLEEAYKGLTGDYFNVKRMEKLEDYRCMV